MKIDLFEDKAKLVLANTIRLASKGDTTFKEDSNTTPFSSLLRALEMFFRDTYRKDVQLELPGEACELIDSMRCFESDAEKIFEGVLAFQVKSLIKTAINHDHTYSQRPTSWSPTKEKVPKDEACELIDSIHCFELDPEKIFEGVLAFEVESPTKAVVNHDHTYSQRPTSWSSTKEKVPKDEACELIDSIHCFELDPEKIFEGVLAFEEVESPTKAAVNHDHTYSQGPTFWSSTKEKAPKNDVMDLSRTSTHPRASDPWIRHVASIRK